MIFIHLLSSVHYQCMVSIFLFVELFKNCVLAHVHVKAFLNMSRSHCHVFCHALHALPVQEAEIRWKKVSLVGRYVFCAL